MLDLIAQALACTLTLGVLAILELDSRRFGVSNGCADVIRYGSLYRAVIVICTGAVVAMFAYSGVKLCSLGVSLRTVSVFLICACFLTISVFASIDAYMIFALSPIGLSRAVKGKVNYLIKWEDVVCVRLSATGGRIVIKDSDGRTVSISDRMRNVDNLLRSVCRYVDGEYVSSAIKRHRAWPR
jgi:hypothetical protein